MKVELIWYTKDEQAAKWEEFRKSFSRMSRRELDSMEREIKKTTAARRRKALVAAKTGKVPAGFMPAAKLTFKSPYLSDAEAAKVVLPALDPWTGKLRPAAEDREAPADVAVRYLRALGHSETEKAGDRAGWSCGCVTLGGRIHEACAKHERPLVTGAEE